MSRKIAIVICLLSATLSTLAQSYQPYTIGTTSDLPINKIKPTLERRLTENGFKVCGSYTPSHNKNSAVIAVTSDEIIDSVTKVGGLSGFSAGFRVALTTNPTTKKTTVSYMTPNYWGLAYFRDDFEKVKDKYKKLNQKFNKVFSVYPDFKAIGFGSKKGLSKDDLTGYQYMWGMPEFDDTDELNSFKDYKSAINKIDSNLAEGVKNLQLVYSIEIPGQNLKVYGIALNGPDGESSFVPTIDFGIHKHTAFLPYEILVKDNEVHMLHGKFRIALSFPDLSMGSFMKIVSTPGDIEDLLKTATE